MNNAIKKGGRGYSAQNMTPNMDKRQTDIPLSSKFMNAKSHAGNLISQEPVRQGGAVGKRQEKYLLQGVIK